MALALVFLAVGSGAQALSCLSPDVVRSYKQADADSAQWGAVVGRLDFDETRLPKVDWDRQQDVPPRTEIRAQFIGHSLGFDGWTRPFQQNVTLRVLCFGPWCAAPTSGARYLAFVKREASARVVIADPCGGMLFPNPDRAQLDQVQTCFQGGPCEEAQR